MTCTLSQGWACLIDGAHHAHVYQPNYEIIFFEDGAVRAVVDMRHETFFEWDAAGDPICQLGGPPLHFVYNRGENAPISPFISTPHVGDIPFGFSYQVYLDGRHVRFSGEELSMALAILPLPIARAVAKQLPALTLEGWRREFNKKYQRKAIVDRIMAITTIPVLSVAELNSIATALLI
jgi:hypothetical protein